MKESVSCIFKFKDSYFFVKRQNFLRVFPGYTSPPGGKVEDYDSDELLDHAIFPKNIAPKLINAMAREVSEEVGFDLFAGIKNNIVESIHYVGIAVTPEFNPYRFKNYYFVVEINEKIDFTLDCNEAEYGSWHTAQELLQNYKNGQILIVPPALNLIKTLEEYQGRLSELSPQDFAKFYNADEFVPEVESVCGVIQFLPLSHTFPPANRTNCFLIGDKTSKKILIDPSPISEIELKKLLNNVNQYGVDAILITHHHKDHWEYSRDIALKYNVPMMMSAYTFKAIGEIYFSGINVEIIKEGDVVTTSLGDKVKVYEVPGHDEGQLALAPDDMRWFLAGDLIQTIGTVVIGDKEGDMKKYFHSLNRVIELNPKFVIPSHGIIIGGVNKLVETLEHRKTRENQIIELLKKNKSMEEILEIVYVGLKVELLPYALKTIRAHIKKIEEEQLV